MSMSLNKAMLIGRVTHDPELRYTPQGTAVCTFNVATNRVWTDNTGQRQEDTEFTRCVAWTKLAEICSQILNKGRQVYVDGRLKTREWEGQDGLKRRTTELVLENMIALGPPASTAAAADDDLAVFDPQTSRKPADQPAAKAKPAAKKGKDKAQETEKEDRRPKQQPRDQQDEEVTPEEIPF